MLAVRCSLPNRYIHRRRNLFAFPLKTHIRVYVRIYVYSTYTETHIISWWFQPSHPPRIISKAGTNRQAHTQTQRHTHARAHAHTHTSLKKVALVRKKFKR